MEATTAARRARDQGIERAATSAERADPGWLAGARVALERYLQAHPGETFICEHVRRWAEGLELIEPPVNQKAWGNVFRNAARDGLIRKTGEYELARSSHLSPKPLWSEAV